MSTTRRHRRQRGQTLVIFALATTVIVGAVALATDLTVHTHDKRTVQNAADAAALVGAQDLDGSTTPSQASRIQGATDALQLLHTQLQLPTGNGAVAWAAAVMASAGGCGTSGSVCDVSTTAGNDVITLHSPPLTATNTAYNRSNTITTQGQDYFEVTVKDTEPNGFGAIVGQLSGTVAGHAVAYHHPGGQPFGFALWSGTIVTSGNQAEVIDGDVYSYRNVTAQSNGHAAVCAQGGSIVLGGPQYPDPLPSPDPAGGALQQFLAGGAVTTGLASCASVGSGTVGQTAAAGCPTTISGVTLTTANSYVDPYTGACVASAGTVSAPQLEAPTIPSNQPTYSCGLNSVGGDGNYQPGVYSCRNGVALSIDRPLDPGIYRIENGGVSADLTISTSVPSSCGSSDPSGYNVCLDGVTFILDGGASMTVSSKVSVWQTPYPGPANSSNPNDGVFSVYAAPGPAPTLTISKNGTTYASQGTLYMPSGTVSVDTNAYIDILGQAIVNAWNVQSGNHPNPDISYDASRVAVEREVLRLVE